ncbi:AraC family transcriptional regulator [Pelagovum pacificum]|uniref:AraC family transcriptional regulator n=1 Tax=Pelagovum pacificum TaxID=2588711 RepID=A0A5C5GIR9_9RHOB|nr:AraC family transcriptional regulator [Pelagovum pacificum]QQA42735.1 AraC family transcriptional regulator [Pelagovum pacificum]TNY34114.1 AraC family transcriptional regulator [Pelagovum pacificum]
MATVTTLFARTLARAAGLDMTEDGALLSDGEVVYKVRPRDDERITDADYFALIEWIRDQTPDETALAFAYAETLEFEGLGVLGLAFKSAPTLRDSLRRFERYFQLVTDSVAYRLDESETPARFLIARRTAPNPVLAFRNTCALVTIVSRMRSFAGSGLRIEAVTFRHPCPDDPARYEANLGCPVRFEAAHDAIHLAPEVLDTPNRIGDAGISDFLTAHLDQQVGALATESGIEAELSRYLAGALSDGMPRASEAARALGMSERTLFRRLSDAGETYQGVVQRARMALAEDLLLSRDCSIAEVAFLTGFSEQSSFTRAFKRWAGTPPASYRREARPA